MIKAIVFDLDGVVVVNKERFSSFYAREHMPPQQVGAGFPRPSIKTNGHSSLVSFFEGPFQKCLVGESDLKDILPQELPGFGWKGSVEEFMTLWFETEKNVDPSMIEYIRALGSRGYTLAIATNQEKHRTLYLVDDMGLGHHFHHVFSSAHVGATKPDHRFFESIVQKLGVKKNEILFWDDTPENVEGAKSFGINAHLYKDLDDCKKLTERYLAG